MFLRIVTIYNTRENNKTVCIFLNFLYVKKENVYFVHIAYHFQSKHAKFLVFIIYDRRVEGRNIAWTYETLIFHLSDLDQ